MGQYYLGKIKYRDLSTITADLAVYDLASVWMEDLASYIG
jgi:hypothetical protein